MDSRRKPRSSWSRSTTELRPSASRRLVGRQEVEVRRPVAGPASLGVAGAHEEPVRPGVEARRVAELRKVPPDGEQRLLRRVLGEVDVAQDPVRHRVESVARGDGEAREGLLVTVLRPSDQLGIHVLPPYRRPIDPGVHTVWARSRSGRLNLQAVRWVRTLTTIAAMRLAARDED